MIVSGQCWKYISHEMMKSRDFEQLIINELMNKRQGRALHIPWCSRPCITIENFCTVIQLEQGSDGTLSRNVWLCSKAQQDQCLSRLLQPEQGRPRL